MRPVSYRSGVAAAVVSAPAAALVSAWVVGDLSAPGPAAGLDYAVPPVGLPAEVEGVVGIAGLSVLLLTVVVACSASRAWPVLACLSTAGLVVGAAYRVMTAGVIGANIGAGLVVFFGGPLLLGLLLAGTVLAVRLRPGRRGSSAPGPRRSR